MRPNLATEPLLFRACWLGHEPAEALNGPDRTLLLRGMVRGGWTDLQIARHTRWTVYTVARMRNALGLPANLISAALRAQNR